MAGTLARGDHLVPGFVTERRGVEPGERVLRVRLVMDREMPLGPRYGLPLIILGAAGLDIGERRIGKVVNLGGSHLGHYRPPSFFVLLVMCGAARRP
jgi:hypothetical protein